MMRLVGRSNKVGHLSSPDREIDRQVERLDVGRCFSEGFGVWKTHPVLLASASAITALLGAASGMLLIGSLYAGLLMLLVKAMDGARPTLSDLFAQMKRFPGFFLIIAIGLVAILSGIVLALFPFVLANWHAVLLDGRMAYSARFEVLAAQLLHASPGFRLALFSMPVGAFYVVAPRVFLGVRCFYMLCLAADRGLPVDEVYVASKRAVQKHGFRPHVLLMLAGVWIVVLSIEVFALLSASSAGALVFGAGLVFLQPFLLGLCASAYRQTLRLDAHQLRLHEEAVTEMRSELQTARDMQLSLLPSENPNVTGYDLADICIPANAVCGDYYAYRWLDDRHFALIVADVCGKAMKAAVTALRFNEMLRYECRQRTDAAEILAGLDAALKGQIDGLSFITCCVAVLDTRTHVVEIASAGHCEPFYFSHRDAQAEAVTVSGFPLGLSGALCEDEAYEKVRLQLEPGDALILYSDGVVEATNLAGDQYEETRLAQLLNRSANRLTPVEMVDRVVQDLERHMGNGPQIDDISLLVLKRGDVAAVDRKERQQV